MMAKRGVFVSHESIREWSLKFGTEFAKRIRHQSAMPGDQWYLDEAYLSIGGKLQYLWRAVDQDGEVLDILVQPRQNKNAAKRFFRKLLKDLRYIPRVLITHKLGSYAAAIDKIKEGHLKQVPTSIPDWCASQGSNLSKFECRFLAVDSTGRCNTCVKSCCWCFIG